MDKLNDIIVFLESINFVIDGNTIDNLIIKKIYEDNEILLPCILLETVYDTIGQEFIEKSIIYTNNIVNVNIYTKAQNINGTLYSAININDAIYNILTHELYIKYNYKQIGGIFTNDFDNGNIRRVIRLRTKMFK